MLLAAVVVGDIAFELPFAHSFSGCRSRCPALQVSSYSKRLMFFSRPLLVVYKNTGGLLWTKPWGLPSLTKTQKRTRQKNVREVQEVRLALLTLPGLITCNWLHLISLPKQTSSCTTASATAQVVQTLKEAADAEPAKLQAKQASN